MVSNPAKKKTKAWEAISSSVRCLSFLNLDLSETIETINASVNYRS